jgi:hypothetical protein
MLAASLQPICSISAISLLLSWFEQHRWRQPTQLHNNVLVLVQLLLFSLATEA